MSAGALVGGVAGLNAILLAAGYCVLSTGLRGARARVIASYGGVALVVGAGLVGAVLCVVAVAGATIGPLTLALVSAGVAGAGLVAGRFVRIRAPEVVVPPEDGWRDVVAAAACAGLVAIAGFALVGGFRSAPSLDDTWFFWVPKGVALGHNGLDLRLWGANPRYPSFVSPDYPLWWSSLTGLDLRFVGSVDLRAVDAQLAILLVAFVGAVARLLWGLVRPWILWPGLLLVLASPELLRQAHGGGADIPVAIYVVLLAVGGGVWLARGDGLALITAFASAAAALAIKNEGLPEALLVVVVLSLAGLRAGRTRLAWLWAAFGGGLALAAPWFVWRQMHGIAADVSFSRSFDVGYLLDRTDRIRPTLDTLQTDLFSARSWLVAVPFAIALAALCVARLRRPLYVAPVALLVLLFALLVWVYWADSLDLGYRLRTSGYRTVDVLTLLAGVSALVLAEALVRGGRGRSPRPGRRAAAKA